MRRYSFLIRPRRASFLARLFGKEDPSASAFRAHLHSHGMDRLALDIWLDGDHTVRKVREHSTAPELALLEGEPRRSR